MTKYKYDENKAVKLLKLKRDLKIENKTIYILKNKIFNSKTGQSEINLKKVFDIGNKSWGKIDFLVNYCNYNQIFVREF